MPTDTKRVMPAPVKRIYRLGQALGSMPDHAKAALRDVLAEYFQDSHLFATAPETTPDKRPFYCGANHLATELRQELEDLMGAAWRDWEAVKQWRESGGEDEE